MDETRKFVTLILLLEVSKDFKSVNLFKSFTQLQ